MIKFTFQNTYITIRIYKLELENKMKDNSIETIVETSETVQINIIPIDSIVNNSNTQQNVKYDEMHDK